MKIFITKYALTAGIQEADGRKSGLERDDGYIWTGEPGRMSSQMFGQREWFETREAAVADAEWRRTAKIASLKKKIIKLEKMKFT